jgi:hypothetical protein
MLGMTKDGGGLSAGYYSQDNYYSKDGDPDQSEWLGKGSEAAGLRPGRQGRRDGSRPQDRRQGL